MFLMRFDMRAPAFGSASTADLYACALEMADWGARTGCAQLVISEPPASEDGSLPSPLLLASAMAARTKTVPIQIAALVVPLHDPICLAEEMAVLDIISEGRLSYVLAVGYRGEEYAMFGQSFPGRGRRMEASIEAFRKAWTGDLFEFEGRPCHVTPKPLSPQGPTHTVATAPPLAQGQQAQTQQLQGGLPLSLFRLAVRGLTAWAVDQDPPQASAQLATVTLQEWMASAEGL